jgi:hypothetical protein
MHRAHIGKKQTAETREKIRLALTGKKQTPETCAKKSESHKTLWQDPDYRGNHVSAKRRPFSRMSPTEETREKLRIASRNLWKNPVYREKITTSPPCCLSAG